MPASRNTRHQSGTGTTTDITIGHTAECIEVDDANKAGRPAEVATGNLVVTVAIIIPNRSRVAEVFRSGILRRRPMVSHQEARHSRSS